MRIVIAIGRASDYTYYQIERWGRGAGASRSSANPGAAGAPGASARPVREPLSCQTRARPSHPSGVVDQGMGHRVNMASLVHALIYQTTLADHRAVVSVDASACGDCEVANTVVEGSDGLCISDECGAEGEHVEHVDAIRLHKARGNGLNVSGEDAEPLDDGWTSSYDVANNHTCRVHDARVGRLDVTANDASCTNDGPRGPRLDFSALDKKRGDEIRC
eukprot:CAMPEP_0185167716 /NCGR_PEP_ID=MMETSP1139-20130426/14726_1 /TAXON_ID=298111 /ORGANISM="Pavlova sp., Strain CCMP459" /LENGTH=218 /DNA_ID=CAMNT_0027733205 /DNA_START=44 /DNA_END=698 /DNA_ORIENTATION=-